MAASSALKNSWAMHQPDQDDRDVGRHRDDEDAERSARQADDHPRPPHAPARDEVRSLSLPKNGLPTIATRAPIPATSARLSGARSIPTSEFTFNASVTSSGARNSRQVLMYASVYSEMKPHPTRCAAGGSASSKAMVIPSVP